jgi:uncharacterized membrane protein YhhN
MKEKTLTHLFFGSALLYIFLLNSLSFPLSTILKPMPIIILIWWARIHMPTNIKWVLLFWALVLSAGGDMALTFSGEESFLAGLALFFFAHLFFIGFFFSKPKKNKPALIIMSLLIPFAAFMFHLFSPHLREMYFPVLIYQSALIIMVSMALLGKDNTTTSKIGALFFLVSDSLLATKLFLFPAAPLSHIVIVTYYLAQFFILKGAIVSKQTHKMAY